MGVNSNRSGQRRAPLGGKLFGRPGGAAQKALWSDQADLLVIQALHAMSQADGILSIGCAMGGAGLVVTTWVDGVKEQQFCGDAATLEDALATLLDYWRAKAEPRLLPGRGAAEGNDRKGRDAGD